MKEEKEKKCGPLPPADPSGPVEKYANYDLEIPRHAHCNSHSGPIVGKSLTF